tara:strand:+ start:368 stop:751 length:384 start_codon:yes stop_codon:yes gene_type:complete
MPKYKGKEFDYTRSGMNKYLRAKRAGGALPVSREKFDEEGRPLDEEGEPIPVPEEPAPAPKPPVPKPSLGKVGVKDKDGKVVKEYPASPEGIKAARDHAKRIGGTIFHKVHKPKEEWWDNRDLSKWT